MNDPVFHYFGNKAGVEGADQVKKVIDDVTKGSNYYQRQQEKRNTLVERIEEFRKQIDYYRSNKSKQEENEEKIQYIKQEIELSLDRVWAHFDMDMFYVACELLDKPELADKPVAVGGKSIISTANYVARKFGVRSAMPTFVANKLCPNLILLPLNFDKYKNISNIFMNILKEYDQDLESMGMDEANLDLTEYLRINNIEGKEGIEKLGEDIRQKIFEATKLTASCGIGPNKMIAKLSSEKNKPNGLFVVEFKKEAVLDFVSNLPIRKIPGIGTVTEQILDGLDIKTCQNVRDRAGELMVVLTPKTFEFIFTSCWGYGRNVHLAPEDQSSVSCQRTFKATLDCNELESKIDYIAEILQQDLQEQEKIGCLLTLVIKTDKFEIKNKSLQLNSYTNTQLGQYGKQIFRQLGKQNDPIRLLGLRMGQLKTVKEYQKESIDQFCIKKNVNEASASVSENNQFNSNQIEASVSNNQQQSVSLIKPKLFQCPICAQKIDCKGNNNLMNKHIDKCLGLDSKKESQQPKSSLDNLVKKSKKK